MYNLLTQEQADEEARDIFSQVDRVFDQCLLSVTARAQICGVSRVAYNRWLIDEAPPTAWVVVANMKTILAAWEVVLLRYGTPGLAVSQAPADLRKQTFLSILNIAAAWVK